MLRALCPLLLFTGEDTEAQRQIFVQDLTAVLHRGVLEQVVDSPGLVPVLQQSRRVAWWRQQALSTSDPSASPAVVVEEGRVGGKPPAA